MQNKKILTAFLIAAMLSLGMPTGLGAQTATTSTTTTPADLLQLLRQQMETLKAKMVELNQQLEALRQARQEVKEAAKEIKGTLRLLKSLRLGMSGEDVKLLQEMLATDPEIYPEGLVTGYFGPLTEKAVRKFQAKAKIEQVGQVGPKTLAKINELLTEGAGASGKVPPGLLIAPGIKAKLGFSPEPLSGQKLPPGIAKKLDMATSTPPATSTPDTTAPVINNLGAKDITATSTVITWGTNEHANSKVWYSTATPVTAATSTAMASSAVLVFEHAVALSGLTASTTYYYFISSADLAGNTATSSEQSFMTK
ncbi:MAG: Peptidoglycan binding protein [Parcubacteria group bacterium Gr01-1014_30]|nr:MAG: Peptidoglycan binding protein [Parcubacteria group bacterium Gr01-1014_30]